jgi:arylsulfatase A-like enzyme
MQGMNIIVLVIDRLHAGFLGCYGNAWVATPNFNRLASESFLFDQAFIDHPNLSELCRSWWTGTHYIERQARSRDAAALANRLGEAGFISTCLTDDPLIATHPLIGGFDEVIPVAAAGSSTAAVAEAPEHTQLANFFAAATQLLDQPREPIFLWLHSRGMEGAWDAPYGYRERYADEDEARPPDFVEPPCRYLSDADDPDELWRMAQAYAGQVTLVDECLGGFLEMFEAEQLSGDTALVVLGARGFPLGRNRRLGGIDQALFSELVQMPLLIRLPDGPYAPGRSQSLVQPGDLAATLVDVAGLTREQRGSSCSLLPVIRDDVVSLRDSLCLCGDGGERAFRTPAWYLRRPPLQPDAGESTAELFAKPDDRWEVNDVAARCPEIVAAMQAAHDAATHALTAEPPLEVPMLDESLVSDLR